MLRVLLSRVRAPLRRSRLDDEIDDEFREHLAMLQERFTALVHICLESTSLLKNLEPALREVADDIPLIASALRAVFEDTSVSEIFGGANQV